MFQPSVKFDKALWQRIQSCAADAGYSSPEEFVRDVLERELARLEGAGSKEDLIQKLKGLGYLE
jgi:metal-responsive CopG/Arc/MetJ family transcriptional regulator